MTTLLQGIDTGSRDEELTRLHEAYIASVNQAVGADDLALADELAREYDADARDLITRRAALAA
jgi:hypothetical protein